MGLFSGIGSGLAILGLIFGAGYMYGHKSYKAEVQLIMTQMDHVKCRVTLGSVRDLGEGVIVCVKVRAK